MDLTNGSHCLVGFAEMQGRREYMEDRLEIQLQKNNGFSYFGVYDGHGGEAISDYLQKNLSQKILETTGQEGMSEKILEIMYETDSEIDKNYPYSKTTGSTCIFALLDEKQTSDGIPLTIYNVGDSRGMIFSNDGCIKINTMDHKPSNHDERERIDAAGGFVAWSRVDGVLAVSRAFGDWFLKTRSDLAKNMQKVTVEPTVYTTKLLPGELLLLASDGLLEKTTDDEVRSFVYQALQEKSPLDLNLIAQKLLNWAYNTNYSRDNLSVILVFVPQA